MTQVWPTHKFQACLHLVNQDAPSHACQELFGQVKFTKLHALLIQVKLAILSLRAYLTTIYLSFYVWKYLYILLFDI